MKSIVRQLACVGLFVVAGGAFALDSVPYSPEPFDAAQQAGKPVAVQFHANWCPTCRAQTKVFDSFKNDPALALTLYVVNYDQDLEARKRFRVGSQSTVIVFRGTKQTARVSFETNPEKLRAALSSAF